MTQEDNEKHVMTLDEAIKHCEEKSIGCDNCANEHKQLAKWLKELKIYKENETYNKSKQDAVEFTTNCMEENYYGKR